VLIVVVVVVVMVAVENYFLKSAVFSSTVDFNCNASPPQLLSHSYLFTSQINGRIPLVLFKKMLEVN
jgi:hypothetical protein